MKTNLFKDFEPVSAKAWKQKIQVDLKGADYNDTLIWESLEGIKVKPFYHQDDFNKSFTPIPGQPISWRIGQHLFIDDEAIVNSLALDAASRGAESLYFTAHKTFDYKTVLNDFTSEILVQLYLHFLDATFVNEIKTYAAENNLQLQVLVDPIGNLGTDGNWFSKEQEDLKITSEILKTTPTALLIDTSHYQNAGANMVQQIAYALSHANEYLNHYSDSLNNNYLTFKISVGSNYFFEIAKIRALRLGYAALAEAHNVNPECKVIATPTLRNKTLYDYNVNMLRTTTECMSAVLGGADMVMNLPYDAIYHKSNEFGERISRNQLLILKEESYFEAVSNTADGSYYIESLTQELAEKSLRLLKDIESSGGFLSQLKDGTIQRKIAESAEKEQTLFNEGKLVLLGTNKHPNTQDRMKDDLELYPFLKHNPRKTLIKPIISKRLAQTLEQKRLTEEE
jgi:methylmalonyl-CoA mutase